jgi:hypothetical protein
MSSGDVLLMVLWTRTPYQSTSFIWKRHTNWITSRRIAAADQKSKFDEKQRQFEDSESIAVVTHDEIISPKFKGSAQHNGTNDD